MTDTKGKRSARGRAPVVVLLVGLLATSFGIITGNGLFSYIAFIATLVIYFYLILPIIKSTFRLNWFDWLCLVIASRCYLIGFYYLLVTNLQPEAYSFMSAGTGSLLILLISKALHKQGKMRNAYLGYIAFFVGALAVFLSQVLLTDNPEMRVVILAVAVAVSLCGSYYAQQSWVSYFLQQRSHDRLKRASLDSLFAEQLKPDKVKEQG